jgi:hypothetical protein
MALLSKLLSSVRKFSYDYFSGLDGKSAGLQRETHCGATISTSISRV